MMSSDALTAIGLVVLLVAGAAVVVVCRSSFRWQAAVVGAVLAVPYWFVCFVPGLHHCDAGYPPIWISCAFATLFGSLVSVGGRPDTRRFRTLLAVPAIIAIGPAGVLTSARLASRYHAADVTGNPQFARGRFRFSAITGVYPRRTDGRCSARASSECEDTRCCEFSGQCIAREGTCVASTDSCRRSGGCQSRGLCSALGDVGAAVTDDDCRLGSTCTFSGNCAAADGTCVRGTVDDCRRSTMCNVPKHAPSPAPRARLTRRAARSSRGLRALRA